LADARETAVTAEKVGADWIVIDGYHFDAAYQKYLKNAGYRLLVWDDNGRSEHYYADLILNQNIHAQESLYREKEPFTKLLLGTSYAILRREFWSWRNWEREIAERAKKVLVTMGGSDPDNVTLKVVEALKEIGDENLQIIVVVGGSNPHYPSLKTAIERDEDRIQLQKNVLDMPSLIAWADMVISAAGSTSWELAFMGAPMLLLVIAENQERIAAYLHEANTAIHLGSGGQFKASVLISTLNSLARDPQLRKEMSARGRQLIDGNGVQRVISVLNTYGVEEKR
jgi:UDP-2,4-diacetamido-2,4,6-trideoxy-beta-L-altropyranose hydrolase